MAASWLTNLARRQIFSLKTRWPDTKQVTQPCAEADTSADDQDPFDVLSRRAMKVSRGFVSMPDRAATAGVASAAF